MDFRAPGEVAISMIPYMQEIIDEFPDDIGTPANTPAADHLFDVRDDATLLSKSRSDDFHHTVAKLLWASLRARPDTLLALSFLTCRVKAPDEDDWKKLVRLISYVKGTVGLILCISADHADVVKWFVDASFGVRADFKSQTGAFMTLGKGSMYSSAKKTAVEYVKLDGFRARWR